MKKQLLIVALFLMPILAIAQYDMPPGHIKINMIIANETEHEIQFIEDMASGEVDYFNHYTISPDTVQMVRSSSSKNMDQAKHVRGWLEANGDIGVNPNLLDNWSLVKISSKEANIVLTIKSFVPTPIDQLNEMFEIPEKDPRYERRHLDKDIQPLVGLDSLNKSAAALIPSMSYKQEFNFYLMIDKSGKCTEVSPQTRNGDPLLEEKLVKHLQLFEWEVPLVDGQAVKCEIPVRIDKEGTN